MLSDFLSSGFVILSFCLLTTPRLDQTRGVRESDVPFKTIRHPLVKPPGRRLSPETCRLHISTNGGGTAFGIIRVGKARGQGHKAGDRGRGQETGDEARGRGVGQVAAEPARVEPPAAEVRTRA